MSFLSCRRRYFRAAVDPRAARTAAGRRRRRSAGKKVGLRWRLGKVASKEVAAVAERLEVLKELVPSAAVGWRRNGGGCAKEEEAAAAAVGADRLFEEAAEYIILLKAKVGVLQRLLQVYDGDSGEEETDP